MNRDNGSPSGFESKKFELTFDFIAKELDFLAALSAVSGAAAAWLAGATLLKRSAEQPEILHSTFIGAPQWLSPVLLVKVVGLTLGATAVLALLQRGKIARDYADFVVHYGENRQRELECLQKLVRLHFKDFFLSFFELEDLSEYWQYYLARLLFFLGLAAIIALTLWPSRSAGV